MIERLLDAERNLQIGFVDRAEAIYRGLAESDPRNAVAVVGLARCALERGDERGAYELAVRALSIDPEDAAALRMEARLSEVLATRGAPVRRPDFMLPDGPQAKPGPLRSAAPASAQPGERPTEAEGIAEVELPTPGPATAPPEATPAGSAPVELPAPGPATAPPEANPAGSVRVETTPPEANPAGSARVETTAPEANPAGSVPQPRPGLLRRMLGRR